MKVRIHYEMKSGSLYEDFTADTIEEIALMADVAEGDFKHWEVTAVEQDGELVSIHNLLAELSRLAHLGETDSEREVLASVATRLGMAYRVKQDIEGLGTSSR